MGRRPSTPPEKYHEAAQAADIEWRGNTTYSVDEKTAWRCSLGHEWETSLSAIRVAIRKGRNGCPHCGNNARKTEQDYHDLAALRGWKYVGPFVSKATTKTWWECDKGHRIQKGYSFVKYGNGCNVCAGQVPKTETDYLVVGKDRNIFWIGIQMPCDTVTGTSWYCGACGNIWQARFDSINQGQGCPKCANLRRSEAQRLTEQDYRHLAERMGYKWVGSLPMNNTELTIWECSKGHRWQRDYSHTERGYQCPKCSRKVNGRHTSRPQRIIGKRLQGEINYAVGSHYVDIAIERNGIRIAIEYDGWHWHGKQDSRDAARDSAILEAGWRLLKIRGSNLLPSKVEVETAISDLVAGETYVEIVLDDWGKGITAVDRFGVR